jgi:glycosyltransferase involved in cell wall biosynthesis
VSANLSTEGRGRRALIWSPSLQGHRLVYCRVVADVLADLGCEVIVAAGLVGLPEADRPRLELLQRGPVSRVLDVSADLRADGLSLTGLRQHAIVLGADLAVLPEADDALAEVAGWDGEGMPARLLALFIRSTNYQYAPQPVGSPVGRVLRRLRGAGRSRAEELQRRLAERRPPGVVALVLDELYAARHPASHRWLPDIYRDPGVAVADAREPREWADRLERFASGSVGRPMFVYVGTNQHRRGYDTLLRLALREGGCVAHCGRFELEGEPYDPDVRAMRATLSAAGRLLETGGPYLDAATADVFLRAARCVVLPYRSHDGSSGVMLQALAAGRPVLVPDRGLMAYRVRGFGLGATYSDGDEADLRRRFRELEERGPESFAGALDRYMDYFARPQLVAALASAVTGEGDGARLPRPTAETVARGEV